MSMVALVKLKAVERPRGRLLCFPYAGGNAVAFHPWRSHLLEGVELWAAQYPGRGYRFREAPFTRLADLLAEQLPLVRGLCALPTVFFGHSMGATVAFELTQLLWAQSGGPMPKHLFLSARAAPHDLPTAGGTAPLPDLSDGELLRRLHALSGTPAAVLNSPELMGRALQNLRADLHCLHGWWPGARAPLPVPITAFGGRDDPFVAFADLEGWRDHTSVAFKQHQFPGHHFFLRECYPDLLDCMSKHLASLALPGDGLVPRHLDVH